MLLFDLCIIKTIRLLIFSFAFLIGLIVKVNRAVNTIVLIRVFVKNGISKYASVIISFSSIIKIFDEPTYNYVSVNYIASMEGFPQFL